GHIRQRGSLGERRLERLAPFLEASSKLRLVLVRALLQRCAKLLYGHADFERILLLLYRGGCEAELVGQRWRHSLHAHERRVAVLERHGARNSNTIWGQMLRELAAKVVDPLAVSHVVYLDKLLVRERLSSLFVRPPELRRRERRALGFHSCRQDASAETLVELRLAILPPAKEALLIPGERIP